MSESNLSLLLRIRGDSAGARASVSECRTAISSLRSSTHTDFSAIQSVANSALSSIQGSVTNLAGSIPVVGSAVNGMTSSLSATVPVAGAVVAVALALDAAVIGLGVGLFNLTQRAADFQGKLFDLSQQTAVSVETLSTLEFLARKTGSNLDSITSSLVLFQTKLEAAQDPTSKEAALLKGLGIETNNTEEALRQALAALAKMPEGFHQTNEAAELFGRRGAKQLLAILKESNGDIDLFGEKLRAAGVLITTDAAKAADEFNDTLLLLQLQLRGVTAIIGNELMPDVLSAVQEISTALKNNREGLQALASLISTVVGPAIKLGIVQPLIGASNVLKFTTGHVNDLSRGYRVGRDALLAWATGQDIATAALRRFHEEQQQYQQEQRGPLLGDATAGVADPTQPSRAQQAASAADLNTIKNAATEAKQIAANQIQIINQMFERGQINRRESILETIRILKISEGQQQEFIVKNLERLEAEKKTATDVAKVEKEIDDLRSQARQTRRQLDSDVAAQESKLLVDQTKQRIQHLHNQTEAYKETADIQIKIIQDRVKAEELTELNGLARITEITERRFAVEALALQRELDLVGRNAEEQEKLRRNLEKLNNEREKTRADQGTRLLEIQKREADKSLAAERRALEVREQQRLTAETRLNRQAENFQALESSALTLQIKNLTANFEERKKLLEQERDAASTSAERKKDILLALQVAEEEYTRTFEDLIQRRIDARNRENAPLPRDQGPLFDPSKNIVPDNLGAPPGQPLGQLVAGAVSAQGAFAGLGQAMAGVLGQSKEIGDIIGGTLTNAFSGLAQAAGQAVQSFVLFGKVEGGFRKFAAEMIAGIAAQAAVQTVYQLAQGLAWLALNFFFPDPRYAKAASMAFASAAVFGSIAGVAAVAGRGIAGNAFASQGAGGGGASGGSSGGSTPTGSSTPQTVDVGRRTSITSQSDATLTLRIPSGWFGDEMRKDYDLNGFSRLIITSGE